MNKTEEKKQQDQEFYDAVEAKRKEGKSIKDASEELGKAFTHFYAVRKRLGLEAPQRTTDDIARERMETVAKVDALRKQGLLCAPACKQVGVSTCSYYVWKSSHGKESRLKRGKAEFIKTQRKALVQYTRPENGAEPISRFQESLAELEEQGGGDRQFQGSPMLCPHCGKDVVKGYLAILQRLNH